MNSINFVVWKEFYHQRIYLSFQRERERNKILLFWLHSECWECFFFGGWNLHWNLFQKKILEFSRPFFFFFCSRSSETKCATINSKRFQSLFCIRCILFHFEYRFKHAHINKFFLMKMKLWFICVGCFFLQIFQTFI